MEVLDDEHAPVRHVEEHLVQGHLLVEAKGKGRVVKRNR
jgi:hypothetical protein